MDVITISRQLGSLGTTLGHHIADQLGYQLVHREIINQAARLAGDPGLALATIDELGFFGIEPERTHQDAYLKAVKEVIEDLAGAGQSIIVGRAGQAILSGRPGVFHLRVIAPVEKRIERIVKAHGVSFKAALAQVNDSDTYRRGYLLRFYNVNWEDPTLYHLVINTGLLDLKHATDVVCAAIHQQSNNSNPVNITQEPRLE